MGGWNGDFPSFCFWRSDIWIFHLMHACAYVFTENWEPRLQEVRVKAGSLFRGRGSIGVQIGLWDRSSLGVLTLQTGNIQDFWVKSVWSTEKLIYCVLWGFWKWGPFTRFCMQKASASPFFCMYISVCQNKREIIFVILYSQVACSLP